MTADDDVVHTAHHAGCVWGVCLVERGAVCRAARLRRTLSPAKNNSLGHIIAAHFRLLTYGTSLQYTTYGMETTTETTRETTRETTASAKIGKLPPIEGILVRGCTSSASSIITHQDPAQVHHSTEETVAAVHSSCLEVRARPRGEGQLLL